MDKKAGVALKQLMPDHKVHFIVVPNVSSFLKSCSDFLKEAHHTVGRTPSDAGQPRGLQPGDVYHHGQILISYFELHLSQ